MEGTFDNHAIKKITDVINFRLPSEVKNLIPVYRRKHLRCGDCRKTRLFEHKNNQRKNKYFFLEIRKSQSLVRKGLKARRMKKGKEAHRENKIYEKIEKLL